MTYREHIQQMIEQLQDIYDRAGALRDHACAAEKQVYNEVRRFTSSTWPWLQKMNNSLSPSRAAEDVGNWKQKSNT